MFALSSACGVGSRIQREELGLPLLRRQAQLGIARHHVARAEREAERVEARVDVAREREQPLAQRRGARRRRRRRTAARCPGRSRTSARRGPRCPARASTSRCRRGRGARATRSIARRDSASLSEAIVRVSGSAPTPCASRFCVSRRMSSPARFSVVDRVGGVQPLVHLAHRHPLQREQVALVDHAERPAVLDDDDLPDAALGHHVHRLVGGGGRRAA